MKKVYFLILLISSSILAKAQVGINTTTPIVTLQMEPTQTNGTTAEGLLIPRLTLQQLATKDNMYQAAYDGTLLYVTDVTGGTSTKTKNVTKTGFYSYNGAEWIGISQTNNVDFFYMPSIVLPLTSSATMPGITWSGSTCSVDLYSIYSGQFQLTDGSETTKNPSGSALTPLNKSKLDYFITYYDNTVYTAVNVTDNGILTYQVATGFSKSEKTFMNIVLKERK